jgi:hypothetical protein
MTGTKLRHLCNPEACVNLLACADIGGYVARVSARTCVLDGDDGANLAVLHKLTAFDFLYAEWLGFSEQFVINGTNRALCTYFDVGR